AQRAPLETALGDISFAQTHWQDAIAHYAAASAAYAALGDEAKRARCATKRRRATINSATFCTAKAIGKTQQRRIKTRWSLTARTRAPTAMPICGIASRAPTLRKSDMTTPSRITKPRLPP